MARDFDEFSRWEGQNESVCLLSAEKERETRSVKSVFACADLWGRLRLGVSGCWFARR